MTFPFSKNTLIATLSTALFLPSQAALIAHYDFADGNLLDDEQGTYDLTETTNGTANVGLDAEGFATFPGNDGTNEAHLEAAGPGGASNFTVSLWVRTDDWTQGNYQGIFSNNTGGAGTDFSWQLDSSGGNIRVVSNSSVSGVTYATSNLTADKWYNFIVRKTGTATELWITEEGVGSAVKVAEDIDTTPGGLQQFRLGVNRGDDSFLRMDMANVKIYDDASISLDTLLAEGPQLNTIPEPSSSALLSLAGLSLILRRRR
ncbi:PEP-CTERM sorting domain-containing protein [Verrucomicrobiaceae bacterium N1E253]|uniref:PEP-CTERM sorting domain-containing protein n=1 Tax=Oceaniferula marina TaxID=2748318 RepID=A0A851GLP8_9BACT|nr:LamG-like jellyroll fold domain-containing protein [Oceaniferula marina]NWK55064.1 PEP-CTERM sorting domain-containing protein [Oceaniferula marina]